MQTHEAQFLRRLGHVIMWGMGLLPLTAFFVLSVVLIEPYVSVMSTIVGGLILRHARHLNRLNRTIHDE